MIYTLKYLSRRIKSVELSHIILYINWEFCINDLKQFLFALYIILLYKTHSQAQNKALNIIYNNNKKIKTKTEVQELRNMYMYYKYSANYPEATIKQQQ